MLPASSALACSLPSRYAAHADPAARQTSPRSVRALQSPAKSESLWPPAIMRVNSRFLLVVLFRRLFLLFILGLSPFLDSQQLVFPQSLECACPFVQRADRHSIHLVKHLP